MRTVAARTLLCLFVLGLPSCSSARKSRDSTAASDPYKAGPVSASGFAWPDGKRAAVSLTFDDARPSQLDAGVPMLDAYGFKATFYIATARAQERLSEWKDVLATGHEIGNHSMRHPCTGNFSWAREKALAFSIKNRYTLSQLM